MTQMHLPLIPQDRGRRNALQNILLAVQDELRRQAPVVGEIVRFAVEHFPELLYHAGDITLLPADDIDPTSVSPYSFKRLDLLKNRPHGRAVFPSVNELIDHLDIQEIAQFFDNAELIGIDESKVDTPLVHSSATFLKSVAFRMYRLPNQDTDEAAGPIVSQLEIEPREDADLRYQLIGYIRNNYIAYVSALTSLAFGRKPFVILHGPLVRAIGGFSRIIFDYEEANKLLHLDIEASGDFDVPQNKIPQFSDDVFTEHNMASVPSETVNGKQNLMKFHRFCIHKCGRQCNDIPALKKPIPDAANNENQAALQKRAYPGFCLYFWMLRSLFDLNRLTKTTIASAVEDISAATEMTRILLPSLMSEASTRQIIANNLQNTLKTLKIDIQKNVVTRRDAYKKARDVIKKLKLTDSGLMTHFLSEGEYTTPVQIYRYQSQQTHTRLFGDNTIGVEDEFDAILRQIFPSEKQTIRNTEHPGYKVLMSYVRTTPIREPVRFEYFHLPSTKPSNVIAPMYALSIPYQEYGLPIILYYADKIARTPSDLMRRIIEYEYLDLILTQRYSEPVKIMEILGRLSRGYFQRDGL